MSVDLSEIYAALGGGVGAVVIIALGVTVIALYRRLMAAHKLVTDVQDARIADHKEHAADAREMVRTLDTAMRMVSNRDG